MPVRQRRIGHNRPTGSQHVYEAQRRVSEKVTSNELRFDRVALVLQGGGPLGAHHIGAYQALAEACFQINFVAGISIGATNAALIAGSEPADRLRKLHELWDLISWPDFGQFVPLPAPPRSWTIWAVPHGRCCSDSPTSSSRAADPVSRATGSGWVQGGSVSASPIDYLTWAHGVQGPSLRAMDDPDDFHRIGQHGYAMINGSGSLAGVGVLVDRRALVAVEPPWLASSPTPPAPGPRQGSSLACAQEDRGEPPRGSPRSPSGPTLVRPLAGSPPQQLTRKRDPSLRST